MNEYGAIPANDESSNILYVVSFTYVPYSLQEDVEPEENQLAYTGRVCNVIYIYFLDETNNVFMLMHVKGKKNVTL